MSKIFVLRLNSLMSSADSTLRFGTDNEIVIPFVVVSELQNYRGKPEKVKIASEILRYLETFDVKKLYSTGVKQSNGSILRVVKSPAKSAVTHCEDLNANDNRIFEICLKLQGENQKRKVILVSKKPAIRLAAREIGINAEDFRDDLFPSPSEQYTGRAAIQVLARDMESFFKDKYLHIDKVIENTRIEWIHNMFVEMTAIDSNRSALGRYDGEKIVPLLSGNPYGIITKNSGQRMMMDCLLHSAEEAPLVILKGSAGTGKTYCTLAYALQSLDDKEFARILVATPSETVGNEKLGFLPGDMRDKISPYLGGIKDNLSILINARAYKSQKSYKERNFEMSYMEETGEYYFETGKIQVQPIGFLRGRTIVNTIFIIDETQNIDPGDIKSIVTRAAEGSKFIFLGDPTQVDNPKLNENYNGLVYLSEKMKGNSMCYQLSLSSEESVRSKLSNVASKIL